MNPLAQEVIRKRGCIYCADVVVIEEDEWTLEKGQCCCPYDKCPYKVLNKYNSYTAYLRAFEHQAPWMI